MALDPVRFVTADCRLGQAIQSSITQQNKAFLNANAGLSGNPVSIGLNVLAQVSTAIRIGQTSLPGLSNSNLFANTFNSISSIAPGAINQGATAVLSTIGVSPSATSAITSINPGIALAGISQAQNVFTQVKQGGFSSSSIISVSADLQSLSTLAGNLFTPASANAASVIRCGANPYAMDLIGKNGPKSKFMFVVQFLLNAPYSSMFPTETVGSAFLVKQSTRPKIDFEYDDINMYNFRTKVPKRTIYQPMTMTLYDHNNNNVTRFFTHYLQAMSPIANVGGTTGNNQATSASLTESPQMYALDSMNDALSNANTSAASLGPLMNNNINYFSVIRLFHVYNYGKSMTVYSCFNPKVTSINPDDVTMMESGNGSELSFDFTYDGLFVIPEYDLSDTSLFNITDLSGGSAGATYPISPAFGPSNSSSIISSVNNQVTQNNSNNNVAASSSYTQLFGTQNL